LKNVIVITGPTASGKTALAIGLARKYQAEIISADSRQVYRELNIGVARPTPDELSAVPHHFVGHVSIHEAYSAGQFGREAFAFLKEYFAKKNTVVICGGTGLYLKALLQGIDRKPADETLRQELHRRWSSEGLPVLAKELEIRDPALAQNTDLSNPRRVIRALEWLMAGKPAETVPDWPQDWSLSQYRIDWPRPVLYDRINRRVDLMMAQGLWEEAASLFQFRDLNALKTVGYQEIFEAMQSVFSRETAVDKIKQHTRNFAKRQTTWFQKQGGMISVPGGTQEEMLAFVLHSQGNSTG
jgi:tRNA dimethylallyltransferase